MKSVYTLFIGLLIAQVSFGQVALTEVYFPKYLQGVGTGTAADDRKVPFACRLTITGLLPDSNYRYFNRFNVDSNNASTAGGEGIPMFYSSATGTYSRFTASPSFGIPGRYATFKADATGSYTGWFMIEATSSNTFFSPGKMLFFRLMLNNPVTPTQIKHRLNVASPVTVINFGSTAGEGTGVRCTPVTGGVAKNFVFLWDNVNGAGRPVAGTIIEADGAINTVANGYAPFYGNDVNEIDKTWGTIIPNNLPNGIQKIGQYSFANGSEVGYKISSDGKWPVVGGSRVSTAGTSGGLTNIIVMDGAIARLDGANIKTDQTLTFNTLTAKTYGDGDFATGVTTSAGTALPLTYSSNITTVADTVRINNQLLITIKGAGNANITASQPGDDFYNAAPDAMQPLTVDKAMLTVTANDHQIQQGDPIPALALTYSGFKNGDDEADLLTKPVASTTATPVSQAGLYEIIPNGNVSGASANYDFQYVKGWLNIVASKQPQKINFAPITAKTYGHADFDPGAIAESGLQVEYVSSNTAVADTANGKIQIKGVGTTTITAKQGGNSGWLAAADSSVNLTVNKGILTITADNKIRKEGQSNPVFTVTYSGFGYGETAAVLITPPIVGTLADTNSPAGDYDITVTGAAANNYTINPVKGKLTIEPLAVQTISFDALSTKKYGDADFTITASASSLLPVTFSSSNTAVATIQNNRVHIVSAGTITITASQAGNTTWGPASVSQTLIVQKARLIIKADTLVKNEGQPVPALTITYSGFVKNEDSTVLTSLPVVATNATASSVPGTYPITVSGAVATNYSIAQLTGILTVLPVQGAVQDNVLAYINRPGQLQVNVFSVTGGKGVIQVFDGNGTRLVNINVILGKGYNTFHVPVGNVSPGIYNVRVAVAGVLLKTKVIIQ